MQLGKTCTLVQVPWYHVIPTARVSVKADDATLRIESYITACLACSAALAFQTYKNCKLGLLLDRLVSDAPKIEPHTLTQLETLCIFKSAHHLTTLRAAMGETSREGS